MTTSQSPDLAAIEAVYRFKFSETERALLEQTSNALLDPYQQQHRHILILATRGVRCPGCNGLTCRRAACLIPEKFTSNDAIPDDSYTCPLCQARLIWHLGITGDEWFTLAPGQTVTVP